jgi:hypothetical protein
LVRLEKPFDDGLLEYGFRFVPQKEQVFIASFARLRWPALKYDFSRREYIRLRRSASKNHVDKRLLHEFDRDYCFTHVMARRIRTGAHNSMTGMCYDVAIRNYARIAGIIEGHIRSSASQNNQRLGKIDNCAQSE